MADNNYIDLPVENGGATSSTNVNIHDSNGNPINSTSGSLDVTIVNPGSSISFYNEITAVAMASTATILTYTVPAGLTLDLTRVLVSSDSVSVVEIEFNGIANSKQRLTFTDFNTDFNYAYKLTSGTVITVIGNNQSAQGVASFNATLQGILN